MKKFYFLLIALLCSATMAFAYDAEIDGIYYDFDHENKTATVTNDGDSWDDNGAGYIQSEIVIPEKVTYNGVKYTVTSIEWYAFYGCSSLTSITIPNSVTSIGVFAFYGCSSLTSITIPNSVTSIGGGAFYGCLSLTSIDVETNNQNYASIDGVLYNKEITTLICYPGGKTSITILNSVTSIGYYAFATCSLTSITIPNSVTSIGGGAFSGCSSLTSITIPNSVTSIGEYTFFGCSSLTSITIPNSVTEIGNNAFDGCSSLTSITIPNSVTSIGESAFSGCSSLTSITIPNSVTLIGERAFYGCSALTSVQWNAKKCNNFSGYYYDSYYDPFNDIRGQITSFTFGDSVEHIPAYLCCFMSKLTSITIPNSVTSIGVNAFGDCTSLTSITIPESVTLIGSFAFYGTPWLENQSDGCVYINNCLYTYKGEMSANTHIDVKEGTTRICDYAFYGCSSLTSITIPNSVTEIGYSVFYNCQSLTSITIPNSVTSIGSSAFEGCSSLTLVTIGNSVTSIGSSAFYGCQSLTSITIQVENPLTINEYTFKNVSRSVSIKVPCGSKAKYQTAEYWREFINYEEVPAGTLTVDVNDKTMGFATITKQNNCTDDVAQVQAQALAGYEFVRWSDGATENPHILLVTEDMTITAEFRVAGTTNVETSVISSASVYGSNGVLYVEGAETDYYVLDAAGRLIYTGRNAQLQLPHGVYVIAIGGEVQKVVL